MSEPCLSELVGDCATREEFVAAVTELCERGLITCTRGRPGDADARYAVAWLPLDHPERFPQSVRDKHAANMRTFKRGTA